MSVTVRAVSYFYATVVDKAGEAYRLLSHLAEAGVNLLAFSAMPSGPEHAQLVLFPDSADSLIDIAKAGGFTLIGPQQAFLVQGDDHLGAMAGIYRKLFDVKVDVYASSGVTDGRGGFGYVLYVRPASFERARQALGEWHP
jgi:hypothetical protein